MSKKPKEAKKAKKAAAPASAAKITQEQLEELFAAHDEVQQKRDVHGRAKDDAAAAKKALEEAQEELERILLEIRGQQDTPLFDQGEHDE